MRRILILVVALAAPLAAGAEPSDASHPTVRLLRALIQTDTSNPPGNEGKIAALLRPRFESLGFEVHVVQTPEAGKAHFIARLRGDGSMRPVLLAAHADVVGAESENWSADPFAGELRDDYVYGRGALDFKGGLAVFAEAAMRLARNDVRLARDVIFVAQADEEGGAFGTEWLARNHWELIDAEFALNEGGWIIQSSEGEVLYASISTADKVYLTLRFTSKGTATHSSIPRPDSAILALAQALSRLGEHQTEIRLLPATRSLFRVLASLSEEPERQSYTTLATSEDPVALREAAQAIDANVLLRAYIRATTAPVRIAGGVRGNVIPQTATADVNFRLIPGTDLGRFIEEIRNAIRDPSIEVEIVGPPGLSQQEAFRDRVRRLAIEPSSENTALYQALRAAIKASYPETAITSYLFQAGTDAVAWRIRGVPVYGIYPYRLTQEDIGRLHGIDERVATAALVEGTDIVYETLINVAAKKQE